jgi:ATP-dependent Lon protease
LIQGRRRIEIIRIIQKDPYYRVIARQFTESISVDREVKALMRIAAGLFEKCVHYDRSLPEEANLFSLNINEPGWLADMIAMAIAPGFKDRKELIKIINPSERLKYVNKLLAQELDVLQLEDDIQNKVQREVDRSQREFYLREQVRAIQLELGEGNIWEQEIAEYRKKIQELLLPSEVSVVALKEVERLAQGPSMSPELSIIRNYLDWILGLPWKQVTEDNLNINHASRVLRKNHFGLNKAKERLLEYIAVRSLKPKKTKQPILCFVGPPGTGKTSLGKSMAEALGRKFVRLSLGGIRDEAEIRGHRRTYIGALPGRILQTMRRAGTINPLFMLDELDKLGRDFRGDPSAALLEVLDPEQNYSFSDHFLEVAYDLSQVMFITTANTTNSIPPALLDRMETIEFPGYIEEEKIEIAKKFLIPRQIEENGLEKKEITICDESVSRIIRGYTYEAGVRNLEREVGKLCRKISRLKSQGKDYPKEITVDLIKKYLGPSQYFTFEAESKDEVGVATAIAWTENGGDIMPIEVLVLDGKGDLQITGQVGEIMQESAKAALSYLKSRTKTLQIKNVKFEKLDIHIHVPEGAIQKDGPSAGVSIATALVSAFTKRKAYKDVGMTGEITLRGKVLPVGGIRVKVLAAHRVGIKKIIIPKINQKDLIDIPRKALKEIKVFLVEHLDEVLEVALYPPIESH